MSDIITIMKKQPAEQYPEKQTVDPEFIKGLLMTKALRMERFTPINGISMICEIGGKQNNFKLNGKQVFGLVLFVDNFNGKISGLSNRQMHAIGQWFHKGEENV
jgi:hypothetical protein